MAHRRVSERKTLAVEAGGIVMLVDYFRIPTTSGTEATGKSLQLSLSDWGGGVRTGYLQLAHTMVVLVNVYPALGISAGTPLVQPLERTVVTDHVIHPTHSRRTERSTA